MKLKIRHISAIDETYRQFTSYIGTIRSNVFTQNELTKIESQEVQRYQLIKNCAENILSIRPGRINQFMHSEYTSILTFQDIVPNVYNYTSSLRLSPIMRNAADNIEVEITNEDAYQLIVPLILYAMTCGNQIMFHNCYHVDVQNNAISVIIDSMKLDEMNVLCDFFGYELQSQRFVADEIYASGRPALIEVTYKLVEIPGIETIKSDS